MKKWIKRKARWWVSVLALGALGGNGYGLFTAKTDVRIMWYAVSTAIWLIILICASGAFAKIYQWWQKDD